MKKKQLIKLTVNDLRDAIAMYAAEKQGIHVDYFPAAQMQVQLDVREGFKQSTVSEYVLELGENDPNSTPISIDLGWEEV